MNESIKSLKPEIVWQHFAEVLEIPRPSKKEGKILQYLLDFGKKHNLETHQDKTGNVLIRKPATKGMENLKPVVLQCHVDMVCEKNNDVVHDFEKDPIQAEIIDGWVHAKGTTLGADDGIGDAVALAVLASNDIEHGPIECLFTVDEETGLTGAFGLEPGFLKGEILLNLDSEDEGLFFIGCAGGIDTVVEYKFEKQAVPADHQLMRVDVKGLKGGHSGDDINKGLANANKLLTYLLWDCVKKFDGKLANFNGGNLRNAIPREAYAFIAIPTKNVEDFKKCVAHHNEMERNVYKKTESDLSINVAPLNEKIDFIFTNKSQNDLLNSLMACPHGVMRMSDEMENFVETSTNLASVKIAGDIVTITTSQRSSVESEKHRIAAIVRATFELIGAKVEHSDGYPGWNPNPDSEILKIALSSYKKLFKEEGKALAIHAGLECGLIGEKYPDMDMISYGPTLRGVHSPDERLEIATVPHFWELTLDILKSIPKK